MEDVPNENITNVGIRILVKNLINVQSATRFFKTFVNIFKFKNRPTYIEFLILFRHLARAVMLENMKKPTLQEEKNHISAISVQRFFETMSPIIDQLHYVFFHNFRTSRTSIN